MNSNRKDVRPSLDLVIPVYNEEEMAGRLLERLREVFSPEAVAAAGLARVEIVFVDDGSRDRTLQIIREKNAGFFRTRIVQFSRNFGHQAAVTAGLRHSRGDLVAVMDADLQDPPEVILEMLRTWREGYDVVYGVRKHRRGNPLKIAAYWLFYRLYQRMTPIQVPMDSGDFCLMSRRVVDELNKLPEIVRFNRGLRSWVGFAQAGVGYDRPERAAGRSKYNLRRLYELATDGVVSLSMRPLQFAQFVSFLYLVLTLLVLAYLIVTLAGDPAAHSGLWFVLLAILSSNAVVLLCLYILGAYVGRSYFEVKGRPQYVVREVEET